MPTYEQNKECSKRYREKFHDFRVRVPNKLKETIVYRAYESGHVSVNAYMVHLIRDDMGMTAEEWKKAGK